MAYYNLTLAGATLSNGAILAASGGGMPQRITPPAPVFYDWFAAFATAPTCVLLCANGTDILVAASNILKKITFDAAGVATVAWSTAVSGAVGWFRKDSNTLIGARSTSVATFYEVNETTGVATTRTFTGANATAARRRIIWDGTSYWSYEATATLRQFNSSFVETGTTIVLSGTPSQVDYSAGDGTGGIYVMGAVTSTVQKYASGSVSKTWTWSLVTSVNSPGNTSYIEMCINLSGIPVCRSQSSGAIDLFPACPGASVTVDHTNATRLVWPGPEVRGATPPATGGGSQQKPSMDFSSTRLAYTTADLSQLSVYGAIRTIPTVTSTALFSKTFTDANPVTGIEVPGHLFDGYGPSSGIISGDPIQDFRHTRLYYQRIGTDGSPVEFTQGTPITFTPSNGLVLQITAQMLGVYSMAGGPVPYVGGDGGEGPRIAYTPGSNVIPTVSIANIGKRIQLPTSSSSFTATAADSDGSIASYLWTQTSGPNTATLGATTTATLAVSGCIAGTYVFNLLVTDNSGGTCTESVELVVAAAATNVAPQVTVASIGKTIRLPTTTASFVATATDPDGSIASYLWTQLTGTAVTMTGTTTTTLSISGASTTGTRTFRLTVTDNSGGTTTIDVSLVVETDVPQATIQAAQVQLPTSSTTLTCSASVPSGGSITYLWTRISGPSTPTLSGTTTSVLTLTGLVAGTYVYQCFVAGGSGTATPQAKIFVVKEPVVVEAGPSQHIQLPTTSVTITPTITSGAITSYFFRLLSGPNVPGGSLDGTTHVVTLTDLIAGAYLFRYEFTDIYGTRWDSEIQVFVDGVISPTAYVADTGKAIQLPSTTTFFAVNASDPDGSIASYLWAQVSGPVTCTLTNETTSVLTVNDATVDGDYDFTCTVTDDDGNTYIAYARLTVLAAIANVIPTVSDAAQQIQLPTSSVSITATAADADGLVASYLWTQVSGPSTATLAGASTASVTASALVAGTYVMRCTVTDNVGGIATVDAKIFVLAATANVIPTVVIS